MATSIGELFVDLGFNVDDKKLKDFDSSLKSTFNTMLEIAGVSVTLAGFKNLLDGASQGAIKLQNLNTELNINTESVQKFALALHQVNPAVGVDQATDSYKKLAQVLSQIQTTGQGPVGALSLLTGGRFTNNMSVDETLAAIKTNKDNFIAGQGPNGKQRFSELLDQIGIGAGSNKFFDLNNEQVNEMTKGLVVTKDATDKLAQLAKSSALASESLSKLGTDLAAFLAGPVGHMLERATGLMNAMDKGEGFSYFMNDLQTSLVARGVHAAIGGAKNETKNLDLATTTRKVGMGDAKDYLAKTWGEEGAQAIVRRLFEESGMDIKALGDSGTAVGLAQWRGQRQANFKKFNHGVGLEDSSAKEQLDFITYELTEGEFKRVGEKFRNAQGAQNKYATFTNEYEIPKQKVITQNNTYHISSAATAAELKRELQQEQQSGLNVAGAQLN